MNVVDLDGVYLPLLRLNDGDGVEEISPIQIISEIWPEPLPANRIHVFVKLTRRESGPIHTHPNDAAVELRVLTIVHSFSRCTRTPGTVECCPHGVPWILGERQLQCQ